jgi:hypothetical protein
MLSISKCLLTGTLKGEGDWRQKVKYDDHVKCTHGKRITQEKVKPTVVGGSVVGLMVGGEEQFD